MIEEKHVPTLDQLAMRVIDATENAAKSTTFEESIRFREYARNNLVDLIQRMIDERTGDR